MWPTLWISAGRGTAHIRVEFVGRAGLEGSDDEKLAGTLRTDGGAAQLAGYENAGAGAGPLANLERPAPDQAPVAPQPARVARTEARGRDQQEADLPGPYGKSADAPLPPARPFDMSVAADAARPQRRPGRRDGSVGPYGKQG